MNITHLIMLSYIWISLFFFFFDRIKSVWIWILCTNVNWSPSTKAQFPRMSIRRFSERVVCRVRRMARGLRFQAGGCELIRGSSLELSDYCTSGGLRLLLKKVKLLPWVKLGILQLCYLKFWKNACVRLQISTSEKQNA